ncbi:uncharacterized protein PWA37_003799 [Arxiozyma heterogenica]|uniref:Uncharacterized protein n=1 Tax=Arxiozyma heterogenica TaxID=278026 RepID=A0AAN8A5Z9_9SACH|nr:hypothetical protein RI543_004908 [Kazachstania heterogenica]
MFFFENTQQSNLYYNNNYASCKDYFEDLQEDPLLESDNYFLNANSVQSFNNIAANSNTKMSNNNDNNDRIDGYSNCNYNYSYDQTPNLLGDDIFDSINYMFNDLNSDNTLNSPSGYSERISSDLSNGSIFSNDSMLTLSLPLTFNKNIKANSTTVNRASDKNSDVNTISPFSSVVSTPELVQKVNDLYKNINENLLFNNDPSTTTSSISITTSSIANNDSVNNTDITKEENKSAGLNVINENTKKNHWAKVDRVKRIRRHNYNNNNNHVSKLQNPKTGKKIADSRLSVAALAEVLKVDSLDEALATERYILDIFENELQYPLGHKTWIRDTPKCERERLINQLYERTRHKYPYYDKSILETIIRRSTYSMMQSRLRKERKRNRKLSQSSDSNTNAVSNINIPLPVISNNNNTCSTNINKVNV